MPGNDVDAIPRQAVAFSDRETRPAPSKGPGWSIDLGRWTCARCGSSEVRADQVATIDPRYTTGTCRSCRRAGKTAAGALVRKDGSHG